MHIAAMAGSQAGRRPICYLGGFATSIWRPFIEREERLLQMAGLPAIALSGEEFGALPAHARQGLVRDAAALVLDPGEPELVRHCVSARGPLLLRLLDRARLDVSARLVRELERRYCRRLLVAPADEALREAITARLGSARVTARVWGPLLDPECGLEPPATVRFTGIRPVLRGPAEAVARLRRRLRKREGHAADAPKIGVVVFVGRPRGDPSPLAEAVRALEEGCAVLATPDWSVVLGAAAHILPEEAIIDLLAAWQRRPEPAGRLRLDLLDGLRPELGEEAFLERVRSLGPRFQPEAETASSGSRPQEVDLLLAGDMSRPGETVLRIAARIREQAAKGRRVALLHLPRPETELAGAVDPGIDALVGRGEAVPFDPAREALRAGRIEIHDIASSLPALERIRPALRARHWIVHERGDPTLAGRAAELQLQLHRLFGCSPRWTSPSPTCWRALAESVPTEAAPARPPAAPVAFADRPCGRPVLGTVLFDHAALERTVAWLERIGALDRCRLRVLLLTEEIVETLPARPEVEILELRGTDLGRFVAGLDAALWPEGIGEEEQSPTFFATARKAGLPLLLPPGLSLPHLPRSAACSGIERWLQHPTERARRARTRALPSSPRRVLFVTANGVGLGHVTRLAAIARWLPSGLEPVFATMSQAVGVLQQLGFFAELLPSYTGHPHEVWNHWLRKRMEQLLDVHRPAALVLDSSNPYAGVLEAAVARPELRLVWVRRGMWRPEQHNAAFLARAPCFDLVIEPGELAAALDRGATVLHREEVVTVDPIGLLEEEDLFDPGEARRRLGLAPDLPAVLLQLGAGTTRDVARIAELAIAGLRRAGEVQIVTARWMISEDALDQWPGVKLLCGFPIGRYFRAFDFTISAAGYNSFHDILRFGLPAIFVPNEAEIMDDQGARASFAQAAGAAFDLRISDLDCLDDCLRALLDPNCRAVMRANARALARPNGSPQAARAIAEAVLGPRAAPIASRRSMADARETADA